MYDLPPNTLFTYNQNPLHTGHRFGSLPANTLISEIAKFKKQHSIAVPESEAILFYLVNHALHVLRSNHNEYEELPPAMAAFAQKCDTISTRISKALFFHVASVAHGMLWVNASQLEKSQLEFFEQQYGQGFKQYLINKKDGGALSEIKSISGLNINQFLGGLSSIYSFGKIVAWGKPYSMIVKTLHKATNGSYSMYTCADHIWSLCHNGGTVLNKGISGIFNIASNDIFKVLDIQDAGQIPNWIHANQNAKYVNSEIKALYKDFYKLFPKEFKPVDEAAIAVSTKKRVAAHDAMNKQYRAMWQNPANNGATVWSREEPKAPEQKIDNVLIDTFKQKKWI